MPAAGMELLDGVEGELDEHAVGLDGVKELESGDGFEEAGLEVESLIREGSPAKVIAEVARDMLTDLLVISTHGYTGLKHVLMGSIAEQVVRYAPCPVLVVRRGEQGFVGESE